MVAPPFPGEAGLVIPETPGLVMGWLVFAPPLPDEAGVLIPETPGFLMGWFDPTCAIARLSQIPDDKDIKDIKVSDAVNPIREMLVVITCPFIIGLLIKKFSNTKHSITSTRREEP